MIGLYILGYLLIGLIVSFITGKVIKIKDDSKELLKADYMLLGAVFVLWPSALIFYLLFLFFLLPGQFIYKLITWEKK